MSLDNEDWCACCGSDPDTCGCGPMCLTHSGFYCVVHCTRDHDDDSEDDDRADAADLKGDAEREGEN